MKKIIFALALSVVTILPAFVFASPADIDTSLQASSCVDLQNNLRYKIRDNSTNGEVSTLQDFLQSKTYLNSEPTGYFGLLTQKAVKDFQLVNDIQATGYVGPITRQKIKFLTCSGVSDSTQTSNPDQFIGVNCPNGQIFVFDKCVASNPAAGGTPKGAFLLKRISGTNAIMQGQQGTWKIETNSNTLGAPISRFRYNVLWGDGSDSETQDSNVFNHQYSNPGLYQVVFSSYDSQVGGFDTVSQIAYVKVSGKVPSNVSIISPRAGNVYNVGDVLNIRWTGGMRLISIMDMNTKIVRTIFQVPSSSPDNVSGVYNYTIPKDLLSGFRTGTFTVSVYNKFGVDNEIFDTSNPFTIQAQAEACATGQRWNGTICETPAKVSISSFNLNSANAGSSVLLYGEGFQQYDQLCFTSMSVNYAPMNCIKPDSISPTQMSITVPSLDSGIYKVQVILGEVMQSNYLAFRISSPSDPVVIFPNPPEIVTRPSLIISNVNMDKNSYNVGDRYTVTWDLSDTPPVEANAHIGIALFNEEGVRVYNLVNTCDHVSDCVNIPAVKGKGTYTGVIPAGVGKIGRSVSTGKYKFEVMVIANKAFETDGVSEHVASIPFTN